MVLSGRETTTAPPTTLWVVPVADLGGVARHVLDAAGAGLPGWRLVVLCPEGPLAGLLREGGTAVVTGPFGPVAGFRASLQTLRRTVRTLRPAVVHSHLSYADVISACALAGDRRTRLVTTEHGIAADDLVYHGSVAKSRVKAAMHALRLRRADGIIAVSEATRRAMEGKWNPARPITVIPNGVDRSAGKGPAAPLNVPAPQAPRILSLSRLSPEKRLPDLLNAFAKLHADLPGATLTVAGNGPLLGELQELARQLGIEQAVSFPGFLDATKAMAAADVLVQLSVWENCSYTLLDAVTAGLGVVATPVGGNTEILPRECLVEAGDVDGIVEAIKRQVSDVEQRPRLDPRWPDTAEMTTAIVQKYGLIGRK
ncbi:glycosyltransferase family 4 protein [Pseudarthrobacter sp. NamB4]|uniref:glycosyltransferase family 4 protein n=1 Tax=Pseudarthrobacter sp. NamB4 TaxID=2576837 RepID=UPI0010FF433E|nr:glycosyltransferase family 4 protein [Pseudarthrobacter sp. NamB4]TLM74493.1 glycosyltransferase family 4 protein [Pseudarthrobacter sp. NamB4]